MMATPKAAEFVGFENGVNLKIGMFSFSVSLDTQLCCSLMYPFRVIKIAVNLRPSAKYEHPLKLKS